MNTLRSPTKSLHFLNPANYHICELHCIRQYLDFKTAPLPPPLSILNLINVTLYHNLPNCQLNRLQQIQNSLARAVGKAPNSSHMTPILKSLHWLKVNECIEYKLLSLTYKFLTTSQTSYLKGVLQRTFFISTNERLTSFTKLIIILFLSKAVFIKKNFVISIFCAKNRTTIKVLF